MPPQSITEVFVPICAKIEEEISDMDEAEEKRMFLAELGVQKPVVWTA